MKQTLLPLLLIVALSGCETLGLSDKPASIEDRSATAAQSGGSVTAVSRGDSASTGAAAPGVETSGLGASSVSGQPLDAKPLDVAAGASMKGADPRKDPTNPLFKRSIYFDYDSYTVRDEYRTMIEAHGAYLMVRKNERAILQGNADSRGSREYNLALGQKRAEAVRKALAVLGVREEQLEAVSFGEEKPRAVGETEQDFAENRRVDIVYGDE